MATQFFGKLNGMKRSEIKLISTAFKDFCYFLLYLPFCGKRVKKIRFRQMHNVSRNVFFFNAAIQFSRKSTKIFREKFKERFFVKRE